jgi:D-arabinose 1-dehydrogenase-like Zn-dependent alcohol dehydrogenase
VEKILDILIEDEIIGLDERSQILTKLPLENQIHAIIETVIRKQAHQSFLEALKKSGNSHVVDKITGCTFQKGNYFI